MAIDLIEEISEIKFKLDDLIMDPDKRKAMPDVASGGTGLFQVVWKATSSISITRR